MRSLSWSGEWGQRVNEHVIMGLRQVPETKLRIIDLAWQVVNEDGSLDDEKTLLVAEELEEAVDEAEAYCRATKEAIGCLRNLAQS